MIPFGWGKLFTERWGILLAISTHDVSNDKRSVRTVARCVRPWSRRLLFNEHYAKFLTL